MRRAARTVSDTIRYFIFRRFRKPSPNSAPRRRRSTAIAARPSGNSSIGMTGRLPPASIHNRTDDLAIEALRRLGKCLKVRRALGRALHHSGRCTYSDTVRRDAVGDHTIGTDYNPCPNRDSLEDERSRTDPCAFAYLDRLNVVSGRRTIGQSLFQGCWMAVVVTDLAVGCDQNVVFDNHFAVAGDGHVVPNKRSVPNTQGGIVVEFAGGDCEAAAEADIVANVNPGVSLNTGHRAQLQMFPYRFAAAAEYRGGDQGRCHAFPQHWNVKPEPVE